MASIRPAHSIARRLGGWAALCVVALPVHGATRIDELLTWVRSPEASYDERRAAMTELRVLGGGPVEAAETRESVIGLARIQAERDAPSERRAIIADLIAATGLYPSDPRTLPLLLALAERQTEIGDAFGAHQAYGAYHATAGGFPDAGVAAAAADNAASALDMRTALGWTGPWQGAAVEEESRKRLELARLKAGAALSRADVARASLEVLEESFPETLHTDPDALYAIADLQEASGALDAAERYFDLFSNVHPSDERRPAAMLRLAEIRGRLGKKNLAVETLNWLVGEHSNTLEAALARTTRLEIQNPVAQPAELRLWVEAAHQAVREPEVIEAILDRMFQRFMAAGHAMESWLAMSGLARAEPSTLTTLVARQRATVLLEPTLQLLLSRKDDFAVAAVSERAASLEIAPPLTLADRVDAARARLGLAPLQTGGLDVIVDEVNAALREGLYAAIVERCEQLPAAADTDPADVALAGVTAACAEADWRSGRPDDALARIDRVLQHQTSKTERPSHPVTRELTVLRADIRAAGARAGACKDYVAAARLGPSPWVDYQVRACTAAAGGEVDE